MLLSLMMLVDVVKTQLTFALVIGLCSLELLNSQIVPLSFFFCLSAFVAEQREQIVGPSECQRFHNGTTHHHSDRCHYTYTRDVTMLYYVNPLKELQLVGLDDVGWNNTLPNKHVLCPQSHSDSSNDFRTVLDI